DWEQMIHGIEALTPLWKPGTETGYHAITFGYLVGEVVRRIDGRSVGAFFRDEIATPLGMTQIYIGLPEALDGKVATLKSRIRQTPEMAAAAATFMGPESLTARALGSALPGDFNAILNSPRGHRAEIP